MSLYLSQQHTNMLNYLSHNSNNFAQFNAVPDTHKNEHEHNRIPMYNSSSLQSTNNSLSSLVDNLNSMKTVQYNFNQSFGQSLQQQQQQENFFKFVNETMFMRALISSQQSQHASSLGSSFPSQSLFVSANTGSHLSHQATPQLQIPHSIQQAHSLQNVSISNILPLFLPIHSWRLETEARPKTKNETFFWKILCRFNIVL